MREPNFLVVGEPKSGTSALHQFLSEHPEAFMPEIKELDYFCKDFHKAGDLFDKKTGFNRKEYHFPNRTKKQYLKHFRNANCKAIGEASPRYLLSKVAASEIHKFNPEMKIIMLFREPAQYLFSLHNQNQTNFYEPLSFEEALKAEKERKRTGNYPIRTPAPALVHYSEMVDYPAHLKRFLDKFPRKQILIIPFEEFRANNERVFKRICKFLGITTQTSINFRSVNARKKFRFPRIQQLAESRLVWGLPKKILPKKIYNALKWKIINWNFSRSKETLNEELRAKINLEHANKVAKLSKLSDINFAKWWNL